MNCACFCACVYVVCLIVLICIRVCPWLVAWCVHVCCMVLWLALMCLCCVSRMLDACFLMDSEFLRVFCLNEFVMIAWCVHEVCMNCSDCFWFVYDVLWKFSAWCLISLCAFVWFGYDFVYDCLCWFSMCVSDLLMMFTLFVFWCCAWLCMCFVWLCSELSMMLYEYCRICAWCVYVFSLIVSDVFMIWLKRHWYLCFGKFLICLWGLHDVWSCRGLSLILYARSLMISCWCGLKFSVCLCLVFDLCVVCVCVWFVGVLCMLCSLIVSGVYMCVHRVCMMCAWFAYVRCLFSDVYMIWVWIVYVLRLRVCMWLLWLFLILLFGFSMHGVCCFLFVSELSTGCVWMFSDWSMMRICVVSESCLIVS